MESTSRLYETLVQVLGHHRNWLDVRHRKTLAWMVDMVRRWVQTSIPVAPICVLLLWSAGHAQDVSGQSQERWQRLEPGLDLGIFDSPQKSAVGDSRITVLRVDPEHFELRLLNASDPKWGRPNTAKAWCEQAGIVAAINAGMYQNDHRTSVALMRTRSHVNNPHLSMDRAVLAFDRLDASVPRVQIIDRQYQDFGRLREHYGTLVQSIRMVSLKGENVWKQHPGKWSAAAIGMDRNGRVLFIHVRSPYTTHDLIDILLKLPIGLRNAMYVEGGPEAQLYVKSRDFESEWIGSFETGFNENDLNDRAWPVPNVVGITRCLKE